MKPHAGPTAARIRGASSGDLAHAVAKGDTWSGVMGPTYTAGLSDGGAHVFQLYYESRNPKLPPPDFC